MCSTTTGRAERDATGPARTAQQHRTGQGAGKREEEVEGWAAGLRKGVGGGRERDEQGTETAGQLDNRERDLGERAAAADEED